MNSPGISSGAIHIEPLRGFDGEFYCEFGFFSPLGSPKGLNMNSPGCNPGDRARGFTTLKGLNKTDQS